MRRCVIERLKPVVIAVYVLLSALPAVAAMKITTATMPLPEDEKPTKLASLTYGAEWRVALTTIRLEKLPDEADDPIRAVWIFTGESSRPMVQKVIVEIHLLDGAGNEIKSVKKFIIVKAATADQQIPIKMKVKRADWERAEKVRIKATFTVL